MLDERRQQDLLAMKAALCSLNLDANETAMLDRQLKYVETTIYKVQYPDLRHRQYIPQDGSTPAGADSILYRQFDTVRNAKMISDFADDLPFADVIQREFPIPIKPLGSAYKYSLRDLQHAAFSGVPLDTLRASAARDSIEYELDDIACFGRPEVGLLGLVNNPNVDVISVGTGVGGNTWALKTALEIIADLARLNSYIVTKTNQIYRANTILMGTALFEKLSSMPFSNLSDRTVIEWFRSNNPGITIDGWHRLSTANAAGTGPRVVAYLRDPRVLQEKIPMEFTQLPPQPKGLAFVINTWALTAGVHVYQPGAMVYMDGAA
ncbi:MAG TPA: major capsid family protein [Steroidobacteraceae bacterium]|jgi:hypothetical protein|nr:major capsid family protein [Steroidobacteraceae bacterium]